MSGPARPRRRPDGPRPCARAIPSAASAARYKITRKALADAETGSSAPPSYRIGQRLVVPGARLASGGRPPPAYRRGASSTATCLVVRAGAPVAWPTRLYFNRTRGGRAAPPNSPGPVGRPDHLNRSGRRASAAGTRGMDIKAEGRHAPFSPRRPGRRDLERPGTRLRPHHPDRAREGLRHHLCPQPGKSRRGRRPRPSRRHDHRQPSAAPAGASGAAPATSRSAYADIVLQTPPPPAAPPRDVIRGSGPEGGARHADGVGPRPHGRGRRQPMSELSADTISLDDNDEPGGGPSWSGRPPSWRGDRDKPGDAARGPRAFSASTSATSPRCRLLTSRAGAGARAAGGRAVTPRRNGS